jgi:hypothetical protein
MDNTLEHGSMSNKSVAKESPVAALKALQDPDSDAGEAKNPRPRLSIAR